MGLFLFKRIIHLCWVLIVISILIFFLLSLTPGDSARMVLAASGITPTEQNINQLREELGLNQPLYQQYFTWLGQILRQY